MALKLSTTYKGANVEYHKIISILPNIFGNTTEVKLGVYVNKTTRGANPLDYLTTNNFVLKGVDYTRDDIYIKLKEGTDIIVGNKGLYNTADDVLEQGQQ